MAFGEELKKIFGLHSPTPTKRAELPKSTPNITARRPIQGEDPEVIELLKRWDGEQKAKKKSRSTDFDHEINVGGIPFVNPPTDTSDEMVQAIHAETIRLGYMSPEARETIARRVLNDVILETASPVDLKDKKFREENLYNRGDRVDLSSEVTALIVTTRLAEENIRFRKKHAGEDIPTEMGYHSDTLAPKILEPDRQENDRRLFRAISKTLRNPTREVARPEPHQPSTAQQVIRELRQETLKTKTPAEQYMATHQANQKLHLTKK